MFSLLWSSFFFLYIITLTHFLTYLRNFSLPFFSYINLLFLSLSPYLSFSQTSPIIWENSSRCILSLSHSLSLSPSFFSLSLCNALWNSLSSVNICVSQLKVKAFPAPNTPSIHGGQTHQQSFYRSNASLELRPTNE